MANVIPIFRSYQYDGTNGTELAAAVNNGSVFSDTGTHLFIDTQGTDVHLDLNDWLVVRPDGYLDWYGKPATYSVRYAAI